ncbi:hypothetical protein D3C80_1514350 [compost metagenome]
MIAAQQFERAFQFGVQRLGVEPVVHQPTAVAGDLADQLALPADVGIDLLTETFHAHPGVPLAGAATGAGLPGGAWRAPMRWAGEHYADRMG